MPILQNPRHEAFAQARAGGALLEDAYEAAGFAPGHHHASRLARAPEVAERIAELRYNAQFPDPAKPAAIIEALLAMVELNKVQGFQGRKESRLALMDAFKIRAEWKRERREDLEAVLAGADESEEDKN